MYGHRSISNLIFCVLRFCGRLFRLIVHCSPTGELLGLTSHGDAEPPGQSLQHNTTPSNYSEQGSRTDTVTPGSWPLTQSLELVQPKRSKENVKGDGWEREAERAIPLENVM